jgi:hypothetical protein
MGAPPGSGPEGRISHNTSPKHTTGCGDEYGILSILK